MPAFLLPCSPSLIHHNICSHLCREASACGSPSDGYCGFSDGESSDDEDEDDREGQGVGNSSEEGSGSSGGGGKGSASRNHRSKWTFDQDMRALHHYKGVHGNMNVPFRFPVLAEGWPADLKGMKLGGRVARIRQGELYADKKEELEAAGFDFAPQTSGGGSATGWEVVKAALLAYKEAKGDLNIPARFVVPRDDPKWPKSIWGVNLGDLANNIRNHGHYPAHRDDLIVKVRDVVVVMFLFFYILRPIAIKFSLFVLLS